MRSILVFSGLILNVVVCYSVSAQEIFGLEPAGQWGKERPELPEELPQDLTPEKILPPLQLPPEREQKLPLPRIFVRDIRITGSTVLTDHELQELTSPYVNREISPQDLEELRLLITRTYINRGYVNSGAVIPDQTVSGGVITIQVVEGVLSEVTVEGNKWFHPGYFQKRISLDAEPPLHIGSLQERLLLLHLDERIERLNAELRPGLRPGQSVLHVRVQEKSPIKVWLDFNNYQSPTVGSDRLLATVAHQSLTGYGDILNLTSGLSSGIDKYIDIIYTLPLTAREASLRLSYRKNDFSVVEEPFESLDVTSRSEIFEITVRWPFYKRINDEFALTLSGEHLRNKTFLLGEPFSFSSGAEDGESRVSALRFSQEYVYRSQKQVITSRSRLSLGIDAFDATINEPGIPDGRFFSWLLQFQWAQRFTEWDIQPVLRMDLQLADDSLLPLEQISVGGRSSVRGYRENQLVRDNAFIASLETRIPIIRNKQWADAVHLVPFFDYGRGWNKEETAADSFKSIFSAGLGLQWSVTLRGYVSFKPECELFWGYPLRDLNTEGEDLQDKGIHFRVLVSAF